MDFFTILLSIGYLLLGWILGPLADKKVRMALHRVARVRFLRRWFGEMGAYAKLSSLLGLVVRYAIYGSAILLALYTLNIAIISNIVSLTAKLFPRFIAAGLFLLAGFLLASFIKSFVKISLQSAHIDELLEVSEDFQLSHLLAVFFYYTILFITLIVALSQLGLETSLISWLTLVIVGSTFIFFLMSLYSSLRPYLADIFAGVMLRYSSNVKVGDYVLVKGKKYRLISIELLYTRLEKGKHILLMRNSKLMDSLHILRD